MTRVWSVVVSCGVVAAGCSSAAERESVEAAKLSVSTIDPSNGFPIFYEDATNTRVVACLDAADPNCIVAADAGFDPARPLSFPDNFPGEFFYAIADSDKIATPGCPASGIAPGRAFVRTAVEGTFVNDSPVPGDQIVFGRIRIVASGLCPLTRYTFTHPHGVESVITDDLGAVPANAFTEDIGCAAAPCDFTSPEASRAFTDFIRWDPAVAPAAPVGYLGDAVTLHEIVGTPNRVFSIADGDDNVLATTSVFTVSGKLAGPLLAAPTAVEVGGQVVGTSSAAVAIAITNVAAAPVTPGAPELGGPDAVDFAIASNSCTGVAVARDATCTIAVTFTPAATVRRHAVLTVANGGPVPLVVPLTGTGIVAGAVPVATQDVSALAFGD